MRKIETGEGETDETPCGGDDGQGGDVEIVEAVETVETVEIVETVETVWIGDLKN